MCRAEIEGKFPSITPDYPIYLRRRFVFGLAEQDRVQRMLEYMAAGRMDVALELVRISHDGDLDREVTDADLATLRQGAYQGRERARLCFVPGGYGRMTQGYDRVVRLVNEYLLKVGGASGGAVQRLGAGWGGNVGGLVHRSFLEGEQRPAFEQLLHRELGLGSRPRRQRRRARARRLPVDAPGGQPVKGLLAGVRVLDLTRVLAGPYAAMVLADLGAEVIKVELPGKGDEARAFGPFQEGESAYFTSINRGKKSVTIDLRRPQGQDLVRRLAGQCDILLENFRPGSMARFGLDYQCLHGLYPRLVYASISGFGQSGPYAGRPAYDVIVQAMGGLVSITGAPGGEPVRVGSSVADLSAALFSVIGVLAALNQAQRSGVGQQVDISMLDCQVALLENAVARYFVQGEVPGPLGSRHPAITPFQFFRAVDGYIVVAAGNDALWAKLCGVLQAEELIADQRFATNALRTDNHSQLEPLLATAFGRRRVGAWLAGLEAAGVPCGPIHNIAQVVDDPQVAARQMIVELDHPVAGRQAVPNSPLKFSATPVELETPAPLLGQHTDEVLGQLLGLGTDELDKLRGEGVL